MCVRAARAHTHSRKTATCVHDIPSAGAPADAAAYEEHMRGLVDALDAAEAHFMMAKHAFAHAPAQSVARAVARSGARKSRKT